MCCSKHQLPHYRIKKNRACVFPLGWNKVLFIFLWVKYSIIMIWWLCWCLSLRILMHFDTSDTEVHLLISWVRISLHPHPPTQWHHEEDVYASPPSSRQCVWVSVGKLDVSSNTSSAMAATLLFVSSKRRSQQKNFFTYFLTPRKKHSWFFGN